ncbi:MAG: tetraacyldisaccharide 4'-kinase [Planctomycetes bacterium]|nr:tetraacyldisaccharide 4'-kinase [Planctomycetota bacterium]MCW8136866.1 tetraacyldisaccharide 4'-kinase [Planctomycetota bacterium]
MQQRDFIELISGRRRGVLAAVMRLWLRFASWWFACGAGLRLALYSWGVFKRHDAGVPVICVGNLTTGGTGKTPAVAWVVNALLLLGRKPCIVSRGYKGGDDGNDELRVLAELCPGVPHIQNPDRVAAARKAKADGADVVVLDDGFSHVRLRRRLDVLMFDSLNPFGFGRMLPRGLLREPIRSVRRARFAVFSRADVATPERLRDLEDTIRCKGFVGDVAHAAHTPLRLVRLGGDEELSPQALKGLTVAPFCGIGNPLGFQRTLEAAGAVISGVGVLQLDDHQHMDARLAKRQIEPFLRASKEAGAVMALCTQKDAVKLRALAPDMTAELPIYELRVEFRILKGEEDLRRALANALG